MRACECSRRRVCSRLRSYLRSRKSALNFGSVLRVSNRLLELREQLLLVEVEGAGEPAGRGPPARDRRARLGDVEDLVVRTRYRRRQGGAPLHQAYHGVLER